MIIFVVPKNTYTFALMDKISQFQGEYKWLSNFWPCSVLLHGRTYQSVEHAYQASKSNDPIWYDTCSDPDIKAGQIKRLSKSISSQNLWKDWEDIKRPIMLSLLIQKFQSEPFRSQLLNTGDILIEEGNTWGDKFWGIDLKTGNGENYLGQYIMFIRDQVINDTVVPGQLF